MIKRRVRFTRTGAVACDTVAHRREDSGIIGDIAERTRIGNAGAVAILRYGVNLAAKTRREKARIESQKLNRPDPGMQIRTKANQSDATRRFALMATTTCFKGARAPYPTDGNDGPAWIRDKGRIDPNHRFICPHRIIRISTKRRFAAGT
jgi:hypothetical protein